MTERHLSMRGEVVDFNRLRLRNEKKPALGNANMNARGDLIGENGIVIKTQEQIEAEWNLRIAENQQIVSDVNIKDLGKVKADNPVVHSANAQLQHPPGLEAKVVDTTDQDFEPIFDKDTQTQPKARRKIVESD